MEQKEKIRFILTFFVSYFLLLAIGVFVFGNLLVGVEEKLIFLILGNSVNYNAFEFVVYCSGVVSISAYLAGVVSCKNIFKHNHEWKWVIVSVILLFLINLLRIIGVMTSEKLGVHEVLHVISWFLMLFVIVWLVDLTFKKKKIMSK